MKLELDIEENRFVIDDFVTAIIAIRDEIRKLKESEANWKGEAEVLRRQSDEYRRLIENLPQKICLKDRDSTYLLCNKSFLDALNIESDDVAGKTDFDFYPEEIAARNQADDQRVMEKGELEEIEEKCAPEGEEVYLRRIKVPLKNEDGKIIGILDVIAESREIRLSKVIKEQAVRNANLEETVRNIRQSYDYVLDNTPIGIWISIDERIKYVNLKAADILGYAREELISKSFKELLHPEYQTVLDRNNGDFLNSIEEAETNPLALIHKEGTEKWVEVKTGLISWEEKPAIIVYGEDITNRRKMKEGLKNAIKQIEQIQSMANSMEQSFA